MRQNISRVLTLISYFMTINPSSLTVKRGVKMNMVSNMTSPD
jgi:hypothetical protein